MDRDNNSIVQFRAGGLIAFAASIASLRQRVAHADATVATTLPRAGLQIVQPRQTDQHRQRRYVREAHALDVVGWHAMAHARITRDCEIGDRIADGALTDGHREIATAFADGFLKQHGLAHYCAVPVPGVVLPGYPGILQLFRTAEAGPFSDEDVTALRTVAAEFEAAISAEHARDHFKDSDYPLSHQLPQNQFACTRGRTLIFPSDAGAVLDDVLRHNLLNLVEERLQAMPQGDGGGVEGDAQPIKPEAAGSNADRLLVPDRLGDCWSFRLTLFPAYPALTGSRTEPVAVVSHQPECEAWSTLRPSDFGADEEIARLVPALQFMQEHYRGNVSLREIAKTVYLSPFHFHRRFTDLLGITPKHYLYDCQISEAKRRLAAGDLSLKEIAAHCGFAHQSHFTSRFKQSTGLTPTAWRRLALDRSGDAADE